MKRLVSISVICLLALTMHAQRYAVMDFNAGAGVSQLDIDGISAIFATYFTPDGYTAVDHLTIDQALETKATTATILLRVRPLKWARQCLVPLSRPRGSTRIQRRELQRTLRTSRNETINCLTTND